MRVYDTDIKLEMPGGTAEIYEYHDEHEPFIGKHHWHARVIVVEDGGVNVTNLNRDTQIELFKALEQVKDLFEAATTAVLDAAIERSTT